MELWRCNWNFKVTRLPGRSQFKNADLAKTNCSKDSHFLRLRAKIVTFLCLTCSILNDFTRSPASSGAFWLDSIEQHPLDLLLGGKDSNAGVWMTRVGKEQQKHLLYNARRLQRCSGYSSDLYRAFSISILQLQDCESFLCLSPL